ncbi:MULTISPECIES: CoA-binding protein [Mesoflavibacter]|uniref:CoA-binding protein n=1 Tax=Mesoflavibacter profundi TaxID=2708110 RepID=A0ABT4RW51_9FLAO|nr:MULTISPECIES: CoA-binding protein [Mesoflavibacter]MDA0176062.1 CoA-binding protein [Mesoflavibacter profundi]QIJ89694.1 putative CoA-binding domain [Mesoflavibacter sp. HG96]QIJ92422.1 putative CoA-binding domain [Mesoflavibacter sp. HG37]
MKKKTLVLGASLNPTRYSNIAINRLVAKNIPTVAFGLKEGDVASVTIDTDLIDYQNIDTVTLYLNPTRQEAYYDYVVNLKPKRVIFNPGTENPEFYKILEENNIDYEIACTLVLLSTNQY